MLLVPRDVVVYEVIRTRNMNRIAIAAPGDFDLVERARLPRLTEPAFPYCLDFLRRRALYISGLDPAEVQSAPFYYLYLRQHARRVISLPLEHGPVADGAPSQPVFLFSPGRCGSTLLSRVLAEAGLPSVSEPDFFTQMGSWFWSRPYNPLHGKYARAMWAMADDLAATLGPFQGSGPIIKLRAESARAPEMFLRRPGAKSIVLLRGFESWARSTARVFGAGPHKMVGKYLTALRCLAALQAKSDCHVMRYEDWVNDPHRAAAGLAQFLGVTIPENAVSQALAADSQAGTPLEGRVRAGWERRFDGAMGLWRSPKLTRALEALSLPPL